MEKYELYKKMRLNAIFQAKLLRLNACSDMKGSKPVKITKIIRKNA
jgi:hypothetical protein